MGDPNRRAPASVPEPKKKLIKPKPLPKAPKHEPTLLGLPAGLRHRILRQLLPDQPVIRPRTKDLKVSMDLPHTGSNHMVDPMWGPSGFRRSDGQPCHLAFLRANKKLHAEGHHLLYNRTFEVVISPRGTNFLEWHFVWNGRFQNLGRANYAPYHDAKEFTPFPFKDVRTLRFTYLPADLKYFLFHMREEAIAFCTFLRWGSKNTPDQHYCPSAIEIKFDRGPGELSPPSTEGGNMIGKYTYDWDLSSAKDSTGIGRQDITLLLEPFTHLMGIHKCTILLPRVLYVRDGVVAEPSLEVRALADQSRRKIIRPKGYNQRALHAMFAAAEGWWLEILPALRSNCGLEDHHHVVGHGNAIRDGNEVLGTCLCEGKIFGRVFEVLGEIKEELTYPEGSLENNARYRGSKPVDDPKSYFRLT